MDEALIRLQEEELQRTGRYYKHICFLCVPLLCVSCYLYGLRPLLLCGFAVLMGNLCDRLISLLRRRVYQAGDYSNESFALVITLLMPATVDWYVLAAAILAGALIGKEVFGGYGSYPFHPAAVGYAVAAVSWPEQVFRYPAPYANIPLWDASGVATSSTISDTLRSGGLINISALSLVLGEYAAPMGTGAAIVLVACGLFLWMQKDVPTPKELSAILEGVRGGPYEQIINTGMLRCMSKAVYEEKPKGHYGLVLKDYAHFTSPIRRYPDLAIHRIMTAQLKGMDKDTMVLRYSDFAEKASKQSSEREIIAMQIERKAEDCYKAEYARRHLGECYEGRISGVTQRGLFIELDNGVEGFVPASSLTPSGTMLTEGIRLSDPVSGKNWSLGDTMMITIVRADVNLGKIDFEVAPASTK